MDGYFGWPGIGSQNSMWYEALEQWYMDYAIWSGAAWLCWTAIGAKGGVEILMYHQPWFMPT